MGLSALAPRLVQAVGTPSPKVLKARAATAPLMGDTAPLWPRARPKFMSM